MVTEIRKKDKHGVAFTSTGLPSMEGETSQKLHSQIKHANRNAMMHFQIKQSVISNEIIDSQVRRLEMSNKRKNFQIKQPSVWNQITRWQTKRYFAKWKNAFSNEPSR